MPDQSSTARTMRVRSPRPLSVLLAALWKPPRRLRLCHRRSLTPIANSFLGPVTGALDTMPNDPIGEGLARYGLQHSPHRGTMSVPLILWTGKMGGPWTALFHLVARFDEACLVAEFVGIPVAHDHLYLRSHRLVGGRRPAAWRCCRSRISSFNFVRALMSYSMASPPKSTQRWNCGSQ